MSELKRVIQLANLMVTQRAEVDALKAQLEEATANLRRTETEDLPDLMRELGMASVTLGDGSIIDVVDEIDCAITEARRLDAHGWLLEHGFGGLIKTEVSVAFGRGEREQAAALAEQIGEQLDRSADVKEVVHPATLKSFIKEQMAAGKGVPFDLFGVHPYSKAKLKAKRK